MELAPINYRASADYAFALGEAGTRDWTLHNGGINFELEGKFKGAEKFFGRFRLFYNNGIGKLAENGEELASVRSNTLGATLFLGATLLQEDQFKLNFLGGYGMALGMMDMEKTALGERRLKNECPNFAAIVENPNGIKCYLKDISPLYGQRNMVVELEAELGAVFAAVFIEYDIFNHSEAQVMPDSMRRIGIKTGISF